MSILPRGNMQRAGGFGRWSGCLSGIFTGLAVGFLTFYVVPAGFLRPGPRLVLSIGVGTLVGILRCKASRLRIAQQ